MILFPFSDYWWFYAGFTIFILMIIALDLGIFHKNPHEVSVKEATIWTSIWVGLALIFNYLFYLYAQYKFSTDERYLSILSPINSSVTLKIKLSISKTPFFINSLNIIIY